MLTLAARLAHHHLKLVGGVALEPVDPALTVAASRSLAGSALGTALGQLATARAHRPPGLAGRVRTTETEIVLELGSEGLSSAVIGEVAAELEDLFEPSPLLAFSVAHARLCIHLARPPGSGA